MAAVLSGTLSGAGAMLCSKLLFEPIHELWNNRNYFGSEIWDTNALGFQQLMQALHHVWTGQVSPMSVSGAQRAEKSMGVEPKWYPTTKERALSWLGFGQAPKYAEASALQNRIGYLCKEHVAPGARPYQDEANTHARLVARNNLLLAQQSDDTDKIQAAAEAMLAAGYKMPTIKSTLQGEQGDQRMFKQLSKSDQMSLLNQATAAEFERYFPRCAKKETIRQWYREHPPARQAQ